MITLVSSTLSMASSTLLHVRNKMRFRILTRTYNSFVEFGHASVMYSYYLKVVPTIYQSLDGNVIKTNQFSVTEHQKNMGGDSHGLPGKIFILYSSGD